MFSDIHKLSGIAAGIASFIAYCIYIRAIFTSGTTPNRAGWFILVIAGVLLAASYYETGARNTIWVPLTYILGPLIVSVVSVKHGEGGFSRFDLVCLVAAGLSIFLWWLLASPTVAFIINLTMDWVGMLPIIKKAYERPQSENRMAWGLFTVSSVLNLLAVETWSCAEWRVMLYPVSMFLGIGIVTVLVFRKKTI